MPAGDLVGPVLPHSDRILLGLHTGDRVAGRRFGLFGGTAQIMTGCGGAVDRV